MTERRRHGKHEMENERWLKGRDRRFKGKEKGIRDKEKKEIRGSGHVSPQWLNEVLQESRE